MNSMRNQAARTGGRTTLAPVQQSIGALELLQMVPREAFEGSQPSIHMRGAD